MESMGWGTELTMVGQMYVSKSGTWRSRNTDKEMESDAYVSFNVRNTEKQVDVDFADKGNE